jgi:o-succinylbenzoate synthase
VTGLASVDPASVAGISLHRLAIPLVEPRVAAHGTESIRESILVEVVGEDGRRGWGECVALARPTYTSEWVDGAWLVLDRFLVPTLLAGRQSDVVGHPMASAALGDALVDLSLRRRGASLGGVIGSRAAVTSRAVVGLVDDPGSLVETVASRLDEGYRAVKLKVAPGRTAGVRRVRERWPELDLAVDANGSFDGVEDADELRALDDLGLGYIEQPLAPDDLVGHSDLRRRARTAIALDESIPTVGSLVAAVDHAALDLVNVKPGRVGGVVACVELLDAMRRREVGGFCGGMYELAIGRSISLAVAGRPELAGQPSDLGPSASYVAADIADAHVLEADGTIAVPTAPGIGRVPDSDRLAEVTVEVSEHQR